MALTRSEPPLANQRVCHCKSDIDVCEGCLVRWIVSTAASGGAVRQQSSHSVVSVTQVDNCGASSRICDIVGAGVV